MELPIENTQLDCELQELYIISTHWKTDMNFLNDEMRFLKNTLDKYKTKAKDVDLTRIVQFQKIIEKEAARIPGIELNISGFLLLMGPIINHSIDEFSLDVLEEFNALEMSIKSMINYVSLIKRLVFLFLEKIICAQKINILPQ